MRHVGAAEVPTPRPSPPRSCFATRGCSRLQKLVVLAAESAGQSLLLKNTLVRRVSVSECSGWAAGAVACGGRLLGVRACAGSAGGEQS